MPPPINEFLRFFRPRRDPRLLPIQKSSAILAQPGAEKCIASIRQSVGISDKLFERFYLHPIHEVAELVQCCPGSEAHHHAWPGGLIAHILESCANSLRLRKAMILPIGATPEAAARKEDLYNYTVFAAALLHDVAKPLTDQHITVYSRNGRYIRDWDPASGEIFSIPRAAYMKIEFRRDRVYTHHQHSSLIFLQRVLPAEGFRWIQSDKDIYGEFLDAFSSDPVGPVYELLKKGDQISVSKALGAQQIPQFSGAGDRPLWMKIKTALRFLVEQGELSLNRPGAAGWVDERGVWLVSKRAVDAVRDQLAKEGHSGIPGDNNRLFDVMSEGGLLVLNDDGKAIWRCRVLSGSWEPEKPFSLIRLSHDTLWSDPGSVPVFDGQVLIVESDDGQEDAANAETPVETHARSETRNVAVSESDGEIGVSDRGGNFDTTPREEATTFRVSDSDSGERFRQWIENGINHSTLSVNTRTSVVHVLKQGIFLVSPIAFMKFAEGHSSDWKEVQRNFQSLKINLKNPNERDENWWQVRIQARDKLSMLRGWIVPLEHLVLEVVPEPNDRLTLLNPSESSSAPDNAES